MLPSLTVRQSFDILHLKSYHFTFVLTASSLMALECQFTGGSSNTFAISSSPFSVNLSVSRFTELGLESMALVCSTGALRIFSFTHSIAVFLRLTSTYRAILGLFRFVASN